MTPHTMADAFELDKIEAAIAALVAIGEHDAARRLRPRLAAGRRIADDVALRDLVVLR